MQHDFKHSRFNVFQSNHAFCAFAHFPPGAKHSGEDARSRGEYDFVRAKIFVFDSEATVRQIVFVQAHERRAVHLRKLLRLTLLLLLLLLHSAVVIGIIIHRRPCCCCVVVHGTIASPLVTERQSVFVTGVVFRF